MASEKNLKLKADIVSEITNSIKEAESVILFSYQGLSVSDISDLRRKLRETGSTIKVYKNTLTKRALDDLKINLDEFMEGPNAIVFSENLLEPIKAISDFAKANNKLEIRVGIIGGDVTNLDAIKEYASIPSREGLLTMLAGGMIQFVKELSIGLNLYAVELNGGKALDSPKEETPEPAPEVVPEPVVEAEETPSEEAEETEATPEATEETSEEAVEETPEEVTEEPKES